MDRVAKGFLAVAAALSLFGSGLVNAREPSIPAEQLREASIAGLAELGGQGVAVGLAVEGDDLVVAIFIGTVEDAAIARALNGLRAPRPMTHDLLTDILAATGAQIRQVVIDDLRDGVYFATLKAETADGRTIWIDARPSDSIALAARHQVPILISPAVLASAPDWHDPDGAPTVDARIIDTNDASQRRPVDGRFETTNLRERVAS